MAEYWHSAVNTIPIKFPMSFLTEIQKSIQKLIWKHKRSQIVKAILSKKSNAGNIRVMVTKYYSTGTKTDM
jgi:hypothetical protein